MIRGWTCIGTGSHVKGGSDAGPPGVHTRDQLCGFRPGGPGRAEGLEQDVGGLAGSRGNAVWQVRFLIKECQRDRARVPRELRGGHLTLEGYLDDQLTAWEGEEYVEQLLGCLTPVQREVVRLVMDGRPTGEIAERLGKTPANVRQHLKHSRDRLKEHPDIAPIALMRSQGRGPEREVRSTAITPEPRKEEVQ